MDKNGDRKLSREEFEKGLCASGVELAPGDMDQVMEYFDRNGDGYIACQEFLQAIRGRMPDHRLQLVHHVYDLLDMNKDSQVSFDDIAQTFDASEHPMVLSKQKSPQQVVVEFMQQWDKNGDNIVTRNEFVEYYADISAGIADDEYFELMVRRTWHLHSSNALAQTTACRRALVIHTDGTQTIEPILNDEGLEDQDITRVTDRLQRQGITTAKSVVLL
jgi:Ca2+-binding EF-hand superfamily protein